SIETLLHALLPHAVVAHLHEIDALVHLVQKDCERLLQERLGDACEWVLVDYHKPGAPLAAAVARQLKDRPDANVVFLRNHGVVIGAKAVEDVDALLSLLTTRLRTSTRETGRPRVAPSSHDVEAMKNQSYILLQDETLTELVHDHDLYARLDHSWALYPDHVVFLGPTAQTYESVADCLDRMPKHQDLGYPIFIRDVGIFVPEAFNRARHEQLRCYYDVLARLTPDALTTT
ncbi:class II aldolase/adducin family protein, partial [Achromobacter sp. Marseille-Q0513]|uniref:class II aldolase/adducin family protein n=1 Tax=Achromobacter sp. Marseille-Q0513 TaxID=2829161 RepID=UPI001B96B4E0